MNNRCNMIPKSLTDENGEPKVYSHKCSSDRKGQPMTMAELDAFAKEIVKEKYAPGGTRVEEGQVDGADLFVGGGGLDHDVVVRYFDDKRNDLSYKVLPLRTKEDGTNVYPVLALVSLWNATESNQDGEKPNPLDRPAGGDYFVKVWFKTMLSFDEKQSTDADNDTIVSAFVEGWKALDSSFFEKYIALDAQYASSAVFPVITTKTEYIDYINGKYATLRKNGTAPAVQLYRDMRTGAPLVYLNQNGTEAVIEFKIEDGLVRDMIMHQPYPFHKPDGATPTVMNLYEFEYRMLPYLVDKCTKRQVHPVQLADKQFLIDCVEGSRDRITWKWDDFNSTIKMVDDNVFILYWFPEPDMAPLARFAVAIIAKAGVSYYTLELDEYENKPTWYLCAQDINYHNNFGQVDECKTMEEFISLIQSRVLHTRTMTGEKTLVQRIKSLFKKK